MCSIEDDVCLGDPKKYKLTRNLGAMPEQMRESTTVQLLVRWCGYAQLETLRIGLELGDADTQPDTFDQECVAESAPCDYNDHEYSSEENVWHKAL
jgi:hypothetical protein